MVIEASQHRMCMRIGRTKYLIIVGDVFLIKSKGMPRWINNNSCKFITPEFNVELIMELYFDKIEEMKSI